MHFAVVCPHHGYINRGTENMTDDINKVLNKRGHKTRVFSVFDCKRVLRKDCGIGKVSDLFFEKSMFGGFSRKYIGFNPNIEDISFSLGIELFLSALAPEFDLLWSNGEYWCANLINALGKKHNKPTLIFFGGGISQMMLEEAKMLPSIFVVLAPEMEKWVKKKVPKCNVKCIPSGVDLKLFKKSNKIPLGLRHFGRPIVISTAALIKSKRVDLTIRAMHELGKGTLIMTGDGPLKNEIVSLGKKLLGNRFQYLGIVPFEHLPSLYSFADVMVLASDNEPYGAVLFEAMGCGTPVITQKDKTREWMVGSGGMLVDDCSNIKDLATAIAIVAKNKEEYKTREQAEKFSWEKTVDGYEKAINEVIK